MRRSQMDEHPQVAAFFERMTFLPLEKITPMVPPGGAGIGMHVIPVEKAIETENEAVGLEKSPIGCTSTRASMPRACAPAGPAASI